MMQANPIPPRPSTPPSLTEEAFAPEAPVQDPQAFEVFWQADVTASGAATVTSNVQGHPATSSFDGGDVRVARAWVWRELLAAAPDLPAGTRCTILDELTGTHVLDSTGITDLDYAPALDGYDATTGQGTAPTLGIAGPTIQRRTISAPSRRVVLIAVLCVAILLAAVLGTVWAGGQTRGTASREPAPAGTTNGLWVLPSEVQFPVAAGNVAAGTTAGSLVIFDGTTGAPVTGDEPFPEVRDPATIHAAAGDGLAVIGTSESSGVAVLNGKAVPYTDKGAVLDRGPVPVLVGGTAKDRTFWVFKDGQPEQVKPPAPGNSLFGGLPDSGSVWAAAGGKVTYVSGKGPARTVTLTPPAAGASVSSWLKVSEDSAIVLWKTGGGQVLAEHSTDAGAAGAITAQTAIDETDRVTADSGVVLLTRDTTTSTFPEAKTAARCQQPVVTAQSLWCPGDGDSWTSDGRTVPGEPTASGDGFALIAQDGRAVAVPIDPRK